ncbi:type I DNA topoisomerase [Candidatus Gottesmanbacteria bacterium]|nr:type I DNA topoisomerase [Candidatus Gottesmanbacteria bacterium]
MSNLVIVESPTKARTLSRFLGDGYHISATMGHVRDLPENKLGIEIEKDFKPQYQTIGKRSKVIGELKSDAQKAQNVILATDPDREGEAIAWHVSHVLKLGEKGKRIVFHEITKSAVEEAIRHPRTIDLRLVDAQQARRILDRLVGYKLSPLLWNKLGKRWLSAGRVQSVAVRLIVEREREIENFKSQEYWIIEAELQKDQRSNIKDQSDAGNNFRARLIEIEGNPPTHKATEGQRKAEIHDKKSADSIVADLEKATYKVKSVETKETRRYPTPPFITSTMQQAAANKFGFSAKRTMRAAQKLYEEGLITYHRTDSTNIAEQAIAMVRGFIEKKFGREYLPESAKYYKTKSKVAQEAHEAIRPTDVGRMDNGNLKMENGIGREEGRLYEMIWKRFVASQMNEAIFDDTRVDINATMDNATMKQFLLRANGRKMKFDGWMAVYGGMENGKWKMENEEEKESELPDLTIDEILKLLNILPQQKFTEPPPRYTEASLIKVLEEKGIGRPSTYAPIISTIQDRRYVEKIDLPAGRQGRKFHPTDLGMAVNDFLIKHFPDIFDLQFTAKMEDELDSIANGEMKWVPVMHEFYDPLSIKIQTVYKTAAKVAVDLGTTDEKCENCGSPMVVRMSKYGKFLACSRFPECKFTKNILEKTGLTCPNCGGDIIIKRTRRGKQFYGCSNYPKCKFAAWKKEDIRK